MLVDWLV